MQAGKVVIVVIVKMSLQASGAFPRPEALRVPQGARAESPTSIITRVVRRLYWGYTEFYWGYIGIILGLLNFIGVILGLYE